MPLYTRRVQAAVTLYGSSTKPRVTGRITQRVQPPVYPSPQRRREIREDTPSSTFKTSYVLADDDKDEDDDTTSFSSAESSGSKLSREFLKKKLFDEMQIVADDNSDSDTANSAESVSSSSIMSYSLSERIRKTPKPKKVAYTFNTQGTGSICCIGVARADQAWVCKSNDKVITLYHRNGHKKESRTLSTKLDMMWLRQDGVWLVIPALSQSIFRLSQSGKLTEFISFELAPGGVCCTSRNETLVCTMPIQKSQKKGPRPRQRPGILRLGQTGDKIWEIKTKGSDPFVHPYRISVNKNRDICVIDLEPQKEHVVILSPDGEEKCRYYGVTNKAIPKSFDPRGICCDKKGQIYIADMHSGAVHVLNAQGNFSHFLLTMQDGAGYPSTVACDSNGFVWVGFSSGMVRVYDVDKIVSGK